MYKVNITNILLQLLFNYYKQYNILNRLCYMIVLLVRQLCIPLNSQLVKRYNVNTINKQSVTTLECSI